MTKREKIILLGGWLLIVTAILILSLNKQNPWIIFLAIVLISFLFYFISQIKKIFQKFDWEYRLDGDLNLKPKKAWGIVQCLNCQMPTISWTHATKETQSCGMCHKKYKAVVPTYRKFLAYISIFFIFFLIPFKFYFPNFNLKFYYFLILIVLIANSVIIGKIVEVRE